MNKTNVLVGLGTFLCIGGAIASITCLSVFGLNACEIVDQPNVRPGGQIDIGDLEDNTTPFTSVTQEKGDYSRFTYLDVEDAAASPLTPSTGDVTVLVVPVQFSDLNAFTDHDYSMIESGFNGIFKDNSNEYWESCKSFYEKSSNGKLNLNFEITDPFTPNITSSIFNSMANDYGDESKEIITEFYKKGLTIDGSKVNFNDSKYDINGDDYIDGIWLVYNSKNYNEVFNKQKYWAYTTTYDPQLLSGVGVGSQIPGRYANGSILFLGQSRNYSSINPINSDAHTMIHETGHMLGLDDYYDYGNHRSNFSYTGQLDMMDLNIGDHNAFSKYALGWTKAQVIEETTTLTLKPFASSYDSIILPSSSFGNHAFGEYLIVEYYTPTNLFELDSNARYLNSYPLFFGKQGLRIYHVDARLSMLYYNTFNGKISFGDYLPTNIDSLPEYDNSLTQTVGWAAVSHSNASGMSTNKDDHPLIELVSADNQILFNKKGATNASLYIGTGEVFSATKLNKYFENGKFNDGSDMNYSISINDTTNEGIEITIKVN